MQDKTWYSILGLDAEPLFLQDHMLIAIQKGNAVCVRTCPKKTSQGLEGFFTFNVQEAEML